MRGQTLLLGALGVSVELLAGPVVGAPRAWILDDGEKVREDFVSSPLALGDGNPIWRPGQPARLFALRDETVGVQVIVEADQNQLLETTVDLSELVDACGNVIRNEPSATDPTRFVGRPIERFVEHYFNIERPSGNDSASGESLGWSKGSAPDPVRFTGLVPDALVPVEVAPSWRPYPMAIAPHRNGAVWIDITVPAAQPSGLYRGDVVVRSSGAVLASLPIEIEIASLKLPDRSVATMLDYGRSELDRRIGGGDEVEQHLFQLYRRHRLTALHSALTKKDLIRQSSALDGSLYTRQHGYEGPGEGKGDGLLSLGTYGQYGDPDAADLANVEAIADELAAKKLLDTTDVFVYAVDESCSSPRGQKWLDLLATSKNPNARRVRVGWTCSRTPASQPVDIPIVFSKAFDPQKAAQARSAGKSVWVYNGSFPQTGPFLTDAEAVALRMNGWLGAMFDVGRWFYWETTFWYDDNRGGRGAYDPFATAETFHNADGDHCMGDGVLVYPGRQVDVFSEHSVGMAGVIASIRLKNFRRGIEDAGYYALAKNVSPAKAAEIGSALVPTPFTKAKTGDPLASAVVAKSYFEARKALYALIAPTPAPASCPRHDDPADAGADARPGVRSAVSADAGDRGADAGDRGADAGDRGADAGDRGADAEGATASHPALGQPDAALGDPSETANRAPQSLDASLPRPDSTNAPKASVPHQIRSSCSLAMQPRSGSWIPTGAGFLGLLLMARRAGTRRRRRSSRSSHSR